MRQETFLENYKNSGLLKYQSKPLFLNRTQEIFEFNISRRDVHACELFALVVRYINWPYVYS